MDKRYQIFISSTFADLQEERKEVMEAILKLNCFPAGMEMFPAADIEQFEYIKTIIDKSDYYLLVIAGRYGSLADDGKSYTEKEYEYAKSKGIPVLVFVKKDIDNIPSSQTDNDPTLKEKLIQFRNNAMTNRLATFWNDKMELKSHVVLSLLSSFKNSPRVGWVKADTVADTKTLKVLEEVKNENKKLKNQISKLTEQLSTSTTITNIADMDDMVTINYSFRKELGATESYSYTQISWKELFGLIAPDFISPKSLNASNAIISQAIKSFLGFNNYRSLKINHNDFNTIKIQFNELGLLSFFEAKSKGDYFEAMQITEKGKTVLREIRVIRK